jgi:hypothetical protein
VPLLELVEVPVVVAAAAVLVLRPVHGAVEVDVAEV